MWLLCAPLHGMEVRTRNGKWPRFWIPDLAKTWRSKLLKQFQRLCKERKSRETELKQQKKVIEARLEKAQTIKAAAEETLAATKKKSSAAAWAAKAAIKKNSLRFTWDDISDEAVKKIAALEHSSCICSKCRWQSGCHNCDPWKALRYYVNTEGKLQKKDSLSRTALSLSCILHSACRT